MVEEPEEKTPSLLRVVGSNHRIPKSHMLAYPGTCYPARPLVRIGVVMAVATRVLTNQGSP